MVVFLIKSIVLVAVLQTSLVGLDPESKKDRSAILFPMGILVGLVFATWGLLLCAPKECKIEYQRGMGCPKCSRVLEPKSRHCRDCGCCIRGHIFHSKWAGVCVGSRNWREYTGWLVSVSFYTACSCTMLTFQIVSLLMAAGQSQSDSTNKKWPLESVHALGIVCLATDMTCFILSVKDLIKFICVRFDIQVKWNRFFGKGRVASNSKGVFFRGKRDSPPVIEMELVLAGIVPAPLCSSARDSLDLASPAVFKHDFSLSERAFNDLMDKSKLDSSPRAKKTPVRSNSFHV